MKIAFIILVTVFSLSTSAQEFEFNYHEDFVKILDLTNDANSDLYFENLLPRFKTNDETLTDFEVLALMIGFTDNKNYKPYATMMVWGDMIGLMNKKKYKKALKICDEHLALSPLDQEILFLKPYIHQQLGQMDSSDHYNWQWKKIMSAMEKSGDGLTAETAYFALGPMDGQNFIRKYLKKDIGSMGSGADQYGNFVDMLEITKKNPETGKTERTMIYFQIQHAVERMFVN